MWCQASPYGRLLQATPFQFAPPTLVWGCLSSPEFLNGVTGFTAGQGYAALPNTAFIAPDYLRVNASPRLTMFNTTAVSASECNQLCLKAKNERWPQLDGTAAWVSCTMWRYCPFVPGGCLSSHSEFMLKPGACQLQSIFTGDIGQAKSPWSELGGTLNRQTAYVSNSVLGAPHHCIIHFCPSDAELQSAVLKVLEKRIRMSLTIFTPV